MSKQKNLWYFFLYSFLLSVSQISYSITKENSIIQSKPEFFSFLEHYWGYLLLLLILVLQPALLYIYTLRINSRITKEKLAQSETDWAHALDFLDEPIYMVDTDDRIIRANKAYYKNYDTNAKEAVGQPVTKYTHPDGEAVLCKICQARKELIDTVIVLEPDDPINKTKTPHEISIRVIRDDNNKPTAIILKIRDLTESRKAEKALRKSELLFKELLNATPDPLLATDSEGKIILVNLQLEKEFGFSREEIIGQKIERLIPEKHRLKHIKHRALYSASPGVRPMGPELQLEVLHKNGHTIPVNISLSPFVDDEETFVIATIHNISARLENQAELKHLASIPEHNPNPIIEFKKGGDIVSTNPAAIKMFPDINNSHSQHKVFFNLEEEYSSLQNGNALIRDIEVGNSTFEQRIIYLSDTQLFRMYIWDITKLAHLTQEMTYQATHDSLTNLINRREFERQLQDMANDSKVNNKTHALFFMDLDRFKVVNDSCGHMAGDELLKQLTSTLVEKIYITDTLARLGGDEFGLLLPDCTIEKADIIAKNIRQTVEEFRFYWDKKIFKIGVSIGISVINNKTETSKQALSAADTACFLAKKQGRNRVHIYNNKSNAITKYTDENNWLNRINTALDSDEFILYFQQITSVHNNKNQHYEVLIRILDKDGTAIAPDTFIPAAERFNIMSSIDGWVIKNTLLIMQEKKYSHIIFSINLSGQSLGDSSFMNECILQISETKVDTTRICFEITETAMIENLNNAIHSVSTLRGLGCKIALDDFGSGLSSFAYLKNLPVDYLKIDGSLIKDLENDPINITMVKSIIEIGHSMGLNTIAEYVHNDAILDILRDLHIDYVQGYGIAKPILLEDINLNG